MQTNHSLPWWKSKGLVIAGGWHPLPGRIRAKIPSETEEEEYLWEYTEEHILRLKELGITLLISQMDRGLGDTDQTEDLERAKRQAALCHRHGLYHGTYMANTVYFESMLKDYPDCEDWVIKSYDGRFVHYGGEQTFRWVACFNSPGWRQRMKRQIEKAIRHVNTDWLHFDNLAVWPEPDSCHCRYCQEAFRAFLVSRYPTAESQKRRFGFTGFDTFRAPNYYLRFTPPWDVDRIDNPLLQEWLEFRCWTVTDYIRAMATYARELKADICIDSNGQAIRGCNHTFLHGIDHDAQYRHIDVFWDECPDYRPDESPGSIYPSTFKMRGANFLRRLGRPVLTSYHDEETLSFTLTFIGHPGINAQWGYAEPRRKPLNPPQPGVMELLTHYRLHPQLYTTAMPASRIAIWRNHQSLAYVSTDTHLSACVMEHLLFTRRIPFSIVFDSAIQLEKLADFDLVILPDVEFISDHHVKILTQFVEQGGHMLMTEKTGLYTAEPRMRRSPAFAHLFTAGFRSSSARLEETGHFDPNRQWVRQEDIGGAAMVSYGKGRIAYLPRIDYVHRPHAFKSRYNVHYDGIDSRYWKEPYNSAEILDTIRWLYPACEPVKVYGAPELRLDYLAWPDGMRGVALMRCGPVEGTRDIPLAVLSPTEPREGRLFLPGADQPLPLQWTRRGEYYETVLPGVYRHALLQFRP